MSSAAILTLNIAVLCIAIVSIPVLSWSAVRFYKNKTHQILSCRDPYFVLSTVVFVVLGLLIGSIPRCVHNMNIKLYAIDIMLLIETMITYGVLFLFCLKSYLLFFQQRYHSSIQNAAWKKEIDAQHEQNNFYIANKNRWGSFSYVLRWICIPYLWLFVFELLAILHIAEWTQIVHIVNKVIFAIVPLLIFIILTYQLGEFYDVWGIKREIFGQFLCSILLFVSYGLIAAATSGHQHGQLRETVHVGIFVLLYCCLAFSSVFHPLYLLKVEQEKLALSPTSSKANFSISMNSIESLLDSIKDERVFSLFMQHLVSEFATENLLFIVELCQLKHYYLKSQHWVLKTTKASIPDTANPEQFAMAMTNGLSVEQEIRSKSTSDDEYLVIDFNACLYDKSNHNASPAVDPLSPGSLEPTSTAHSHAGLHLEAGQMSNSSKATLPTLAANVSKSISKLHAIDALYVIGYIISESATYDMLQIEIPKTIPKSTIVRGDEVDFYSWMQALHEKYVAVNSNFEINIPFQMRENVGIALEHYRESQEKKDETEAERQMIEGDLFWIMDAACLELLRLLLGPFRRFQVGDEYQAYISSMEYQARRANVEFDQIAQERSRSKKPTLHAGGSYDRIHTRYQHKS